MIESVNNEKIVYFKKLRDKKFILSEGKFIVEGDHLITEAYKSGLLLEVITSDESLNIWNSKCTLVSKKCLEKISLLKSTPSVMGVVKLKMNNDIIGDKIVLLDNVQDPGNIGTIIRSALAFNVSTVILSPDSVNVFNDKLIRSTEGTIFNMNVVVMDLKEAISVLKSRGIKTYYADMNGTLDLDDARVDKYGLVLGSEGKGISAYIKEICDEGISIPMNDKCESLNVSVTGGIIMYKFR